ncbi:MAG: CBS domain-containing protein [Bacteroidota bacterium]|nr:CBS domain-containing protein [Bacteroidota bacterium]
MVLNDILKKKGRLVRTITPDKTVKEAVDLLVEHNIGGLLVVEGGRPVGIITERDVLRLVSRGKERLETMLVGEAMTVDLIIGMPDQEVEETMAVMTEAHIRHLPVIEGDEIAGMISIGDLVKSMLHEQKAEITYLRDYITGRRGL